MNWDAIGAIGEIVGALAVVASLGYLAVQIGQNSRSMKASIAESAWADSAQWFNQIAQKPDLARIWSTGQAAFHELGDDEQRQFIFMITGVLKIVERLHYQFREGNLDEEFWRTQEHAVKLIVQSVPFASWWSTRTGLFTPTFQEYINGIVPDDLAITKRLQKQMVEESSPTST